MLLAFKSMSERDVAALCLKVFDNLFKALRMLWDNIHWAGSLIYSLIDQLM